MDHETRNEKQKSDSKSGDPRLGAIWSFIPAAEARCRFGLLGVPCDEGVTRNGGRAGSALGPTFLREHLKKIGPLINPELNIDISDVGITDFGDVIAWNSLEEMHPLLTSMVTQILEKDHMPLICGGGNDQSYCNARGLMNFVGHGNIAVINVDAHLDVRPLLEGNVAHSGSPFRQLLRDPDFRGKFVEFAAQGNQCSNEHANFVIDKGGRIVWLGELRDKRASAVLEEIIDSFPVEMPVFLSFDIDAIASAHCPGVSCPASIGLSAQDAVDICFMAGCHRNVRLVDFSEYNPKVEAYRTGRLLANMIYYFIMGRRSIL